MCALCVWNESIVGMVMLGMSVQKQLLYYSCDGFHFSVKLVLFIIFELPLLFYSFRRGCLKISPHLNHSNHRY